jgi:predicted TIM-barrel fold metal-dependent hydrolase
MRQNMGRNAMPFAAQAVGQIRAGHAHAASCDCGVMWSRRSLLAGIGAAGIAAALPRGARAQAATKPLIDTHHHFYAPGYLKAWNSWNDAHHVPHFPAQDNWSRERAVEGMDKAGIRTAMLSLASTPGRWLDLDNAGIGRTVRECNDYGATMVRDYPGRFGLFATLTMVDADQTLKEIEYAFDTLKADGVGLQSSYGDKWLGDPAFKPIFEELNRRKAVVYVHPVAGACCTRLSVGANVAALEVPFDTTRCVASLLLSGTLVRTRDIRWLFSHAGGTVPMMAGRLNSFYANNPKRPEFAPEGIEAELQRLHYDTANATFAPNMAALLKFVPVSQVTYGTDYPYFAMDQTANLKALGLPEGDLRAIESGNATRLIPRLKA